MDPEFGQCVAVIVIILFRTFSSLNGSCLFKIFRKETAKHCRTEIILVLLCFCCDC